MDRNPNFNFSAAEISIIIHATEEKEKILEHLNSTLGISPVNFSEEPAEGHWGNKIILLNSTLGRSEANSLYTKVNSFLSNGDCKLLSNFYDEKGNLYIRLDKQRLCSGKVALSERDSVRIKFKPIFTHESCKSTMNRRKTWC